MKELIKELLEKYEGIQKEAGAKMASSSEAVRVSVQARARYFLAREVIKDLRNLMGDDSDLRKMRELEKVKEIADANTLYPFEAKQMPYYSIMTVRDFYGPDDPEEAQTGVYDRKNVVYFRFDFSKLKAIFEIWSPQGELKHVELWDDKTFNLEYFDGMLCDGGVWVVRCSETKEKVVTIKYQDDKNEYVAVMNDGKVFRLDDEVEMMDFVLEKLGGIRVSACMDCWDGCEKCGFSNSIIEKVELDEDAV